MGTIIGVANNRPIKVFVILEGMVSSSTIKDLHPKEILYL